MGELTSVNVGEPVFTWFGFVSPSVDELFFATTSCELPLGFRGEAFTGPFGVGLGIFIGNADDGMVFFPFKV